MGEPFLSILTETFRFSSTPSTQARAAYRYGFSTNHTSARRGLHSFTTRKKQPFISLGKFMRSTAVCTIHQHFAFFYSKHSIRQEVKFIITLHQTL